MVCTFVKDGVQMNACLSMDGPKQAITEFSWSVKSVQYILILILVDLTCVPDLILLGSRTPAYHNMKLVGDKI